MRSPSADAFYVGYLPMPAAHRRTLRIVLPALLSAIAIIGVAFAVAQRDPGNATWDTGALREWSGVVQTIPYPVLINDTDGSALLIVEQGKHGPRSELHAPARHARLRGWLLERDGRRMIELDPSDDAVQLAAAATPAPLTSQGDEAEFVGEILDAKCYLGAMKPGDGRAHKSCATLCVQGGIPPMLFALDAEGRHRHMVIVRAPDQSAAPFVAPFVGEPVRVRGRVMRLGDLDVLAIDGPDAIARHQSPPT